MKYLLVEVQAVHGYLVLFPFAPGAYLSWLEHCLWLGHFSGRLQSYFFPRATIEHSEEVVITARHDGRICPVPTALELVEDTIVLVERAQLGSEVFVNSEGFDRFRLHVKIPDLHRKVVPGNHVTAGIGKLHVGD